MRKLMMVALGLIWGASGLLATPITGDLAIAGASTYTASGIHFTSPAITLIGTGNFAPLLATTTTLTNFNFSSAPGTTLFSQAGISMDLLSLIVVTNNNRFLNVTGTADMLESGFDPTLYDFTLTGTRPDGVSSFTLTAVPAAVAEPESLLLLGTGLLLLAPLLKRRRP